MNLVFNNTYIEQYLSYCSWISLERRWSSRRFSYGYLVTTSPQSPYIPLASASFSGWLRWLWVQTALMVWRAVCTRSENVFTAPLWCAITSDFNFMRSNCRPQSELRLILVGFASLYSFASLCISHCNTCVALDIRTMMTWRHPHLPPGFPGSPIKVLNPKINCNWWQGLRSLEDLTKHLTTRADDSHAAPVYLFEPKPKRPYFYSCQVHVKPR